MAETKAKKPKYRAFRTLRDTSFPKANFYIGETANGDEMYETVGISYPVGSVVLEEDISPALRGKIDDGDWETLLVEIDRAEALAEVHTIERGTFAPEHSVEALAMKNAGHRVLDRETVIELRSLGSDDAADAMEASKEDGADERPNLPGIPDSDLSADEAGGMQVLPSGVMATNPFVTGGKKKK